MTWEPLEELTMTDEWQYSSVIEASLGYVRLKHSTTGIYSKLLVAQAQTASNLPVALWDFKTTFAKVEYDLFEFVSPPFFSDRRLAFKIIRATGMLAPWTVQIEVNTLPVNEIGVNPALIDLSNQQSLILQQLSSLQLATVENTAQIVDILDQILTFVEPSSPPPPPPPPPPEQTPSALGVAYTASQSSVYAGLLGTYANLTDETNTTGASCSGGQGPVEWIQASYAETVRVTAVRVGGGVLPGFGGVANYLNGAKLQSSSDGITWTTVWTVEGVTNDGATNFVTHQLTTPIDARYWRLFEKVFLATTELKFA